LLPAAAVAVVLGEAGHDRGAVGSRWLGVLLVSKREALVDSGSEVHQHQKKRGSDWHFLCVFI
jgi:hypothetical protein